MKLQDRLPEGVTVRGKFYKMDFDFRNVLNLMEILAQDDLWPDAREYLALKCVMKHPRHTAEMLAAVRDLLFPDTKKGADQEKITDFAQDANLIRAAFRQEYGIDLWRDRVHWLEFSALLNAMPEGSRYSEVLGIRSRPMPKATKYNAEERQWLAKAKSAWALEKDEKELETNYARCVHNVFMGLMNWARGDKDG